MSYFASTAHPGTQSVAARARQLAKPPNRLFNTSMFTKVYYDGRKPIAPKPDSKTSENQQVEEMGNVYPGNRSRQGTLISKATTETKDYLYLFCQYI